MNQLTRIVSFIVIVASLCLVIFFNTATVVDGRCIGFDRGTQRLTVEDQNFDISQAAASNTPSGFLFEGKMETNHHGFLPESGDLLRIVYKGEGKEKKILKILNRTRYNA